MATLKLFATAATRTSHRKVHLRCSVPRVASQVRENSEVQPRCIQIQPTPPGLSNLCLCELVNFLNKTRFIYSTSIAASGYKQAPRLLEPSCIGGARVLPQVTRGIAMGQQGQPAKAQPSNHHRACPRLCRAAVHWKSAHLCLQQNRRNGSICIGAISKVLSSLPRLQGSGGFDSIGPWAICSLIRTCKPALACFCWSMCALCRAPGTRPRIEANAGH